MAQRARERALASDQRAGRWARGKARRLQREFVRRNWKIFVTVGGVLVLLIVAVMLFLPSPFARGLYLGSFGTAIVGLMAFWVVQATGTAPTMMGDDAEQWTAQELRKLQARGWRLINHVSLQGRDIDHVLVGLGGAFAVETKWTADEWQLADRDHRVRRAGVQAVRNARTLSLWLRKAGVGTVEPVLFLWGSGARNLPSVQVLESEGQVVTVVAGPAAGSWSAALPTEGLDGRQVEEAWSLLEKYCARRDVREATEAPVPRSFIELASRAFIALIAASTSFLVAASWLEEGPSLAWWIPAGIVLALPAIALAYFVPAARNVAWGWLGGGAISAAFIVYALAQWALG